MTDVHKQLVLEELTSLQKSDEPALLKRREIEASIAVALIRGYAEELGRERAIARAQAVIEDLALAAGQQSTLQWGGNTLSHFAKVVQEVWALGGALEIVFLEQTDRILSFNVTRCCYAEQYERMKLREYGVCLSCCRDAAFARGFNPLIRMERTQTLMEGAPFCDFRFNLGSV